MALQHACRQQQLTTRQCCCCRILAKLPHLRALHLLEPTGLDTLSSAPPLHLRPLLQSLTDVTMSAGSMAALHTLARWTRVSDDGIVLDADEDIMTCMVAVKGWSVGWLRTVLRQSSVLLKPGDWFELPSGYALVDDSDVDMAGLAGSWEQSRLEVCLGQDVTPACLQRLPAPPNLHVVHLQLEDMESYVCEWSESLKFTSAHFQALVRPELKELMIENCHLVKNEAVVALASGAPGLRSLHLEGVEELNNSVVWALCAGCRQLQVVELYGILKVTAAGVLPLLTTAQSLRRLALALARSAECSTSGFVAALREMYPELDDVWALRLWQHSGYKRVMAFVRDGP
jgi:hypothetical protein